MLQLVPSTFLSAKPSSPWPVAAWPPRKLSASPAARHSGGPEPLELGDTLAAALVLVLDAVELLVSDWLCDVLELAEALAPAPAPAVEELPLDPPHPAIASAATACTATTASERRVVLRSCIWVTLRERTRDLLPVYGLAQKRIFGACDYPAL